MNLNDVLPNLARMRAEEEPDRLFLEDDRGRSRTYAEFWEASLRWAAVLGDRGVRAGDRVIVMQPTSIEAYELWCGIGAIHAIEVPVNTQYLGDILAYLVDNSGAEVAAIESRYLDVFLAAVERLGRLKAIVVTDWREVEREGPVPLIAGATAHLDADPVPPGDPASPSDIGSILYTSGTTGPSKGVLVPWGQAFATASGSAPKRALQDPDTVYYSPYPSFHVSGKSPFYSVLLGGGRVVLRERFDTSAFWSDIERHQCTCTMLMGATANFMFRQPARPEDAENSLRGVIFSPWIPEIEAFKKRFDVEAYSVFNMTEISAPIVGGWENEPVEDPSSCGRKRAGYELRIVDDEDQEVPNGIPGELIVRAEEPWALMAGYWQMPEKTVECWRNQWLHTGDLFSVDDAGNYYYLDRKKDSIRRRGENISSMEIERIVLQSDCVLEVAAVGVPDEISEEEVKIVVVQKPGHTVSAADLIAELVDRLPRFMVPRYVEFVDALPKTPTEKVQKVELRKRGVSADTWDRTKHEAPRTAGARGDRR